MKTRIPHLLRVVPRLLAAGLGAGAMAGDAACPGPQPPPPTMADYEVRTVELNRFIVMDVPNDLLLTPDGTLYVADAGGQMLFEFKGGAQGRILAGRFRNSGLVDGVGEAARFGNPMALALADDGSLFVAERNNNLVRRVTVPEGRVSRYRSTPGFEGLLHLGGEVLYGTGGAGVARVAPGRDPQVIAGGGQPGYTDGVGSAARFSHVLGICGDGRGGMVVVDEGAATIRRVSQRGDVQTLAGMGGVSGWVDAVGRAARFRGPRDVALAPWGAILVADGNGAVRHVTLAGEVTTLAGRELPMRGTDGPAGGIRFFDLYAVTSDAVGHVYLAEYPSRAIRVLVYRGHGGDPIVLPPVRIGASVRLNVTPQLASSWEWAVTARPAGSTAKLSASTVPAPDFTPDVEGRYEVHATTAYAGGQTCVQRVVVMAGPVIRTDPPPLPAAGQFSVYVTSAPGRNYRLEYTDSLCQVNWVALPWVAGDGSDLKLTDPAATAAQRFYRVRWEP